MDCVKLMYKMYRVRLDLVFIGDLDGDFGSADDAADDAADDKDATVVSACANASCVHRVPLPPREAVAQHVQKIPAAEFLSTFGPVTDARWLDAPAFAVEFCLASELSAGALRDSLKEHLLEDVEYELQTGWVVQCGTSELGLIDYRHLPIHIEKL